MAPAPTLEKNECKGGEIRTQDKRVFVRQHYPLDHFPWYYVAHRVVVMVLLWVPNKVFRF